MNKNRLIASGFLNSSKLFSENYAVFVENKFIAYQQLFEVLRDLFLIYNLKITFIMR